MSGDDNRGISFTPLSRTPPNKSLRQGFLGKNEHKRFDNHNLKELTVVSFESTDDGGAYGGKSEPVQPDVTVASRKLENPPKALAVLWHSEYSGQQSSLGAYPFQSPTHLTDPPVYSTDHNSQAHSMNPKPSGAVGVNFDSGIADTQSVGCSSQ
jgi:hypothetical protein